MPWYVYDYDKKGVPIQRGPYTSSSHAQRELDRCESQVAEMHEFSTKDPSRAKRQFKEIRCQKLGLTEGIKHFKSPRVHEKEKFRSKPIPTRSSRTVVGKPILVERPNVRSKVHSIVGGVG
jgi:hypothetical protein